MRKAAAYISIALMVVLLSVSCSKKDDEDKALLDTIKEKGEITIAMEGTWAPWTFHDEEDVLTGYDTEVGKLIAEGLGVEPVFVEGEWDGLLAGIDAGRYDIMINGVDVTPERAEKYDFSIPYAFNRTAVIVRADDDRIKTMDDLDGMHTANTISSTYAELAESYGADVTGGSARTENRSVGYISCGRKRRGPRCFPCIGFFGRSSSAFRRTACRTYSLGRTEGHTRGNKKDVLYGSDDANILQRPGRGLSHGENK